MSTVYPISNESLNQLFAKGARTLRAEDVHTLLQRIAASEEANWPGPWPTFGRILQNLQRRLAKKALVRELHRLGLRKARDATTRESQVGAGQKVGFHTLWVMASWRYDVEKRRFVFTDIVATLCGLPSHTKGRSKCSVLRAVRGALQCNQRIQDDYVQRQYWVNNAILTNLDWLPDQPPSKKRRKK